MKQNIAGFDYFEVEFNRQAEVNSDAQVTELVDFVKKEKVTDLLVFSHGWNNDEAEARKLFADWLKSARAVLDDPRKLVPGAANRKFAPNGLSWVFDQSSKALTHARLNSRLIRLITTALTKQKTSFRPRVRRSGLLFLAVDPTASARGSSLTTAAAMPVSRYAKWALKA